MYAITPGQYETRYILEHGIYVLWSVSTSWFNWEESDIPVPGHLPLCHSFWGTAFNHGLTSEHPVKRCILQQVQYQMWCRRCYRSQLMRPFNFIWVGHTGISSCRWLWRFNQRAATCGPQEVQRQVFGLHDGPPEQQLQRQVERQLERCICTQRWQVPRKPTGRVSLPGKVQQGRCQKTNCHTRRQLIFPERKPTKTEIKW